LRKKDTFNRGREEKKVPRMKIKTKGKVFG